MAPLSPVCAAIPTVMTPAATSGRPHQQPIARVASPKKA
jgi:hypothetical protein